MRMSLTFQILLHLYVDIREALSHSLTSIISSIFDYLHSSVIFMLAVRQTEELRGRQDQPESLPVVPAPEMPQSRNVQRW